MRSVLRTGTGDRPVSARAWGSKPVAPPPPPPIEQPFRLQGQQLGEETGLHYNRLRYYDPVVGRFVSQDAIGIQRGQNVYADSRSEVISLAKRCACGAPMEHPAHPNKKQAVQKVVYHMFIRIIMKKP
ncbi:MAG: RHS repeat-associated core domain-containing protein [Delftia acidovorans]|nr:RHS repeat-associated core domain-containing protein [Delftia acidovorans]MBL8356021.1 RHS repeat-associated core domain-containing protein [Delftia acidovorans]